MAPTRDIYGNHTPVVTPLHADGSVDEASLRRVVEHLIEGGVHGILVLGGTGEFASFSDEERRQIMRIAADQVRGRVALGFGTSHSGSRIAAALTASAAEVGGDYVLVGAPYYQVPQNTAEGVIEFFREVAAAAGITIMLYDGGGGVEIPVDTMRQLARETPNVRASKVNVHNPGKVVATHEAGLKAFSGIDSLALLMLGYGADGFIHAIGNPLPGEMTQVFDRARAGDWDGARDVYYSRLLPLINATFATPSQFITCIKLLLYWKGIITTPTVRAPQRPLDPVRTAELKAVAGRLGIL